MSDQFFDRPILNSPYAYPSKHWELNLDGQPTNRIIEARRRSDLITPVSKPKKRRQGRAQAQMIFDAGDGLSSEEQEYNPTPIINEVRNYVETWRNLPSSDQWLVTPESARLLKHWRSHSLKVFGPSFARSRQLKQQFG
jgi:type III restriction enzyme